MGLHGQRAKFMWGSGVLGAGCGGDGLAYGGLGCETGLGANSG